jgi:hypothetical protein
MNIQFSFCRFWHVLVWTLVYHWRQLLTLFSAAFVTFVAVEIIEFIQASNDYAKWFLFDHKSQETIVSDALHTAGNSCMSFLAVLMCVGAAFAFYNLHRKNEGRRLLMLPATNLEKFLARWVVYVPVLFVIYVVAFMLGDLLRMAVWPVFSEEVSFPTAIPAFFGVMKYLVVWTNPFHLEKITLMWGLFWFFHALSLFSSVWIGRWAWLFVTVVFFAVIGLFIQINYQGGNVALFYLLAVVLAIVAYWLFCRFPKYKLFHNKD